MTLVDELLANRDDPSLWNVYADELQSAGDPHGGLISLMLAREAKPSEKLYALEVKYRQQHFEGVTALWRRGFPVDVATSIGELEDVLEDPAMRFLEAIQIAIEDDDGWRAFLAMLGQYRPKWRRARLQLASDEPIAMAPLLAALPALEALGIAGEDLELDWTDARSACLRTFVGPETGETFEDAELPALDDKVVHEDVDDSYLITAFFVVAEPLEGELLTSVATKLGLDCAVEVARLRWTPIPMTAVTVYSTGAHMPFYLAQALQRQIAPAAVAQFALSANADIVRANVIGKEPIKRSDAPFEKRGEIVREVIDIAFGCDPGPDVWEQILQAFAGVERVQLHGHTDDSIPPALDIDPNEAPIRNEEEEDYDDDYDGGYDRGYDEPSNDALDHDGFGAGADWYDDYDDEPVPIDEPPEPTHDLELVDPNDLEAELTASQLEALPERADTETPDGGDAWTRLEDQWSDKVTDPDDDANEQRFPDPELAWNERPDPSVSPSESICSVCDARALVRACGWCGARTCAACVIEDERGAITCRTCVDELDVAGTESDEA